MAEQPQRQLWMASWNGPASIAASISPIAPIAPVRDLFPPHVTRISRQRATLQPSNSRSITFHCFPKQHQKQDRLNSQVALTEFFWKVAQNQKRCMVHNAPFRTLPRQKMTVEALERERPLKFVIFCHKKTWSTSIIINQNQSAYYSVISSCQSLQNCGLVICCNRGKI